MPRSTEGCPFCAIVRGACAARIVANYPAALAFFPTAPAALGHTLVAPRRHVATIWELDRDTAHALVDATLDVADRLRRVLRPGGLNIVQSNGRPATQSVFHLHVHLVPRADGDDLPRLWPPGREWPAALLDDAARRLWAAGGPLSAGS